MTMTAARTATLRQALSDQQQTLRQAVLEHRQEGRVGDAGHGDALDQSDAGIADDVRVRLLQMSTDTLSRVDAALARLDSGAYGDCRACGAPISVSRLRALPFAARCQPCAVTHEQAVAMSASGEPVFGLSRSSAVADI